MLYEFAMTPDLFDASFINSTPDANTILLELLRGIAENGLLANLHEGHWVGHIIEKKVKTLSPALRDKVINLFSILEVLHRLPHHPRGIIDPGTDMDWLELALNSHQQCPLHAIVLRQVLKNSYTQSCDAFVEFPGLLDSHQWKQR